MRDYYLFLLNKKCVFVLSSLSVPPLHFCIQSAAASTGILHAHRYYKKKKSQINFICAPIYVVSS